MALTFEQYLQSLLQSVTTYYTATYSNDTDLYSILQMYSNEFVSGSVATEIIRNNLFIVTCENLTLYDNFGTYFDQNKYFDQTYVEDRYESGSGTFRITTPAIQVTQTAESSDDWEIASTNFPSNWELRRTLGDTVVFDNNFVSNGLIRTNIDQPFFFWDYYNAIRYDPLENEWGGEAIAQRSWVGIGYDTPLMGLITHRPYLGQGQYDQEYMYYFTFVFSFGGVTVPSPPPPSPVNSRYPRVVAVRKTPGTLTEFGWSGTSSDPAFFSAGGGTYNTDPLKAGEQTWTDSVVFHDKLYCGICIAMWDTSDTDTYTDGTLMWALDETHKFPLLIECDPVTLDVREAGLAAYMGNAVGNIDFKLHAMAKHNNKLWIDSSQAVVDYLFSGTTITTPYNAFVSDFESSGSTIFTTMGGSLFYSIDDGNIWNEKVSLQYFGPSTLYCCKEFDAQEGSGSFLYIGTGDNLILRARAPHTSGSWEEVASLALSTINDLEQFDGALFAAVYQKEGSSEYIYKTTDGITWNLIDASNRGGSEFKEFNNYLYAAGWNGGEGGTIIRTLDGTSGSWTDANDGLGASSVGLHLEEHNGYLYAVSGWQLVRTNNGTTWESIGPIFEQQITAILSYRNTLYVGLGAYNGELWSSVDDGETFGLFQTPSLLYLSKLSIHNGYAFCGTFDIPSRIFKWGGGSQHYMTTYDGINFADNTSPASAGDTVLKMHSYNGQLYVIINNSTGGYYVRRYNGILWSTHQAFGYAINTMYEYEGFLLISLVNGDIFYLNTESDTWQQYLDIPDLSSSTKGVTAFANYMLSSMKVYAFVDDTWYSSGFITNNTIHYAIPGAGVSGSTMQYASIPGYKKQLDFMLDAAMHGGTHQGIIRASNAFTLINPDIREFYTTPQWKLKSIAAPIVQLSSNIWQFSNSPSWRDNLWQGAHATFTSGSSISDKIAVGYIILVNDNNTVDVGPIYDSRLLLDLTRPQ